MDSQIARARVVEHPSVLTLAPHQERGLYRIEHFKEKRGPVSRVLHRERHTRQRRSARRLSIAQVVFAGKSNGAGLVRAAAP